MNSVIKVKRLFELEENWQNLEMLDYFVVYYYYEKQLLHELQQE
jgi:hypothetical protein